MTSTEAERALIGILDSWFGEAIENAEDEKQKRRYLYGPLISLVKILTKIEDDGTVKEPKP